MQILLINPIIRPEETPKYFPLGLGYIASSLIRDGHQVSVMDLSADPYDEDRFNTRLRATRAEVIGITGLITEYRQIIDLSERVRHQLPEARLILGGGIASLEPGLMLKRSGAEAVVIGEGEAAVRKLIKCFDAGDAIDTVSGIAFMKDGEPVIQPPEDPIMDLDALPHPAWDLFPADVYFNNMRDCWLFSGSLKTASIITSRGCPYKCVYCDHSIWGRRHRRRTPDSVMGELYELKRRYDI